MLCQIDWYSFTIPTITPITGIGVEGLTSAYRAFDTVGFMWLLPDYTDDGWSINLGRGFYKVRYQHQDTHISVSWGSVNPHVFVELDGQSCALLREAGILSSIIERTRESATRVDCSVDFETDLRPKEFAEYVGNERIFARGYMVSESGETAYIGARQSSRFARVYRFNPPHPRAGLLRVEAEYKGSAAKALLDVAKSSEVVALVTAAHEYFSWTHPLWVNSVPMALKVKLPVRDKAGTGNVRWLIRVAFPALLKANREGLIDLPQMLRAVDLG